MPDNTHLKTTFDEDAEAYNTFRPRYPSLLFDKLIRDTQLTSVSKLLEIGPGTGQATEPLARRGFEITAVELGPSLAAKARHVLCDYPNVNVITGAFEDVKLPDDYFDLVFSATALHWIHPEHTFTKPHRILKLGGYLAIIHTEHVSDEKGDKFFFASQPIYHTYSHNNSSANDAFRLPTISALKAPAIDESLFDLKSFTVFPYTAAYSGQEYAGLLSTYSPTIAMPVKEREEFLRSIERLVDDEFNGSATRSFAMTLTIAKKTA